MGKPAGVQIRRWFVILVCLLVCTNLAGLAISVAITRSVRTVAGHAAPLASATAAVRTEILAAQREMFRYLAEFSDDTEAARGHLDRLAEQLQQARAVAGSEEVGAALEAIGKSAERYRKVLELMPETVSGSRDWARLQEYSTRAVELGQDVEQGATRLADQAQAEIQRHNRASAQVADGASWAAGAVLVASLFTVLYLRHWWKRFQDQILEM